MSYGSPMPSRVRRSCTRWASTRLLHQGADLALQQGPGGGEGGRIPAVTAPGGPGRRPLPDGIRRRVLRVRRRAPARIRRRPVRGPVHQAGHTRVVGSRTRGNALVAQPGHELPEIGEAQPVVRGERDEPGPPREVVAGQVVAAAQVRDDLLQDTRPRVRRAAERVLGQDAEQVPRVGRHDDGETVQVQGIESGCRSRCGEFGGYAADGVDPPEEPRGVLPAGDPEVPVEAVQGLGVEPGLCPQGRHPAEPGLQVGRPVVPVRHLVDPLGHGRVGRLGARTDPGGASRGTRRTSWVNVSRCASARPAATRVRGSHRRRRNRRAVRWPGGAVRCATGP
ncbi:hypothetical protein SFUMM280S_11286 [Streptomyces fumanus]